MTLEQYLEKLKEQYKDSVMPVEIQRLIKIIEVLAEANEFYGDKNNWGGYREYQDQMMCESDHEKSSEIWIEQNDEGEEIYRDDIVYSGYKARQAQAKVNEIIGGEG